MSEYSPKVRSLAFLLSSLAITVFLAASANAQTNVFWNLPASGTWNNAANWNPAVVPNNNVPVGSTYNAIIQAPSATPYTVTLSQAAPTSQITVTGLELNSANATLAHTSGILSVVGQFSLTSGQYNIRGGKLADTQIVSTGGNVRAGNLQQTSSSSTFTNVFCDADIIVENGTLTAMNGTQFKRNITVLQSGQLTFDSSLSPGVFSNYDLAENKSLSISGNTASVYITGNAIVTLKANSTTSGSGRIEGLGKLINQGKILSSGNGNTFQVASSFSSFSVINDNLLEASGGANLIVTSGNTQNNGTIHAKAGVSSTFLTTISLNGTWNNNGLIQAETNSRVNLGGSFTTANIGSIVQATGAQVYVTGSWNNTGNTFNFANTGKLTLNSGGITGGTIDNSANRLGVVLGSVSNTLITGGLTIDSGSLSFRNNSTFSGVANIGTNGTIQFTGVSNTNAIDYAIDNAQINLNFGKLTVTQGAALILGPSFVVQGNGDLIGGNSNDVSSVTNRGAMQMSGFIRLGKFTNDGAMMVSSGKSLEFTHATSPLAANYTNNGTITVQSGGTLRAVAASSNDTFHNAGLIAVAGNLFLGTDSLFSQSAGEIRLLNGMIDDNNANITLTLAAGALTGSGVLNTNLVMGGRLAPGLSTGSLDINGTVLLANSAVSDFEISGLQQGSVLNGYDYVDVMSGLTLDGMLSVVVDSSFENSILDTDVFTIMTSSGITGQFDNAPSGQSLLTSDGRFQFVAYYGSASPFNPNHVVLTGFLAVPESQSAILLIGVCISWAIRRRARAASSI